MYIHFLQHEEFEHPAYMNEWVHERKHQSSITRVDKGEAYPEIGQIDMLVILGGLASVHEIQAKPEVSREMEFIRQAVRHGKIVLAFCFGAQLLSASLGGKVTAMEHSEIGWHEVMVSSDARETKAFNHFPETFIAPVWHGDMFSIPPGARRTLQGHFCANQGFMYGDRVFGFQVLLHMTPENLEEFMAVFGEQCAGPHVQGSEDIRKGLRHGENVNRLLCRFLDTLCEQFDS